MTAKMQNFIRNVIYIYIYIYTYEIVSDFMHNKVL